MADARANLLAAGDLLGLLKLSPKAWEQGGDADDTARIDAAIQARIDARAEKDWAEADRLRNEITALGWEVKDTKEGYELCPKN